MVLQAIKSNAVRPKIIVRICRYPHKPTSKILLPTDPYGLGPNELNNSYSAIFTPCSNQIALTHLPNTIPHRFDHRSQEYEESEENTGHLKGLEDSQFNRRSESPLLSRFQGLIGSIVFFLFSNPPRSIHL